MGNCPEPTTDTLTTTVSAAPHRLGDGIYLPLGWLEAAAGRCLDAAALDKVATALPWSSVPETLSIIGANLVHTEHRPAPILVAETEQYHLSDATIGEVLDRLRAGDAGMALATIGHATGIGVAYQLRCQFEDTLDRPLTDEEWATLSLHTDGFDAFVDDAQDATLEWRRAALARAGITA